MADWIRSAKRLIPLPLRKGMKWMRYAWLDLVDPVAKKRVPKRRETYIGGPAFEVIGDRFLETLKARGLTPGMRLLDVGSGQGRMARPLADFLNELGRYDGVEVSEAGVDWCRRAYLDKPNFFFHHADVFNRVYNRGGSAKACDYSFPFDDECFDFVFLTSVFTHMFAVDIENYMREISRVMKPGGRLIVTWFLLTPEVLASSAAALDFRFPVDEVSLTVVANNPEEAIAYAPDYVKQLYAAVGLEIEEITHGRWTGLVESEEFQDMIVARKPVTENANG